MSYGIRTFGTGRSADDRYYYEMPAFDSDHAECNFKCGCNVCRWWTVWENSAAEQLWSALTSVPQQQRDLQLLLSEQYVCEVADNCTNTGHSRTLSDGLKSSMCKGWSLQSLHRELEFGIPIFYVNLTEWESTRRNSGKGLKMEDVRRKSDGNQKPIPVHL